MQLSDRSRLHALDALRGWTMINMIAYHWMWDVVNVLGLPSSWYVGTPKYLWQQSICWTFILLSGFCWSMSRNHLRRGLLVLGGGVLVALVTHLLTPVSRISFGILICIGSCVLLMTPLEKVFRKVPPVAGLIGSAILFAVLRNCDSGQLGFESLVICQLPRALYRNWLTTYLGFPMPGFFSADYFSLLPWFFLFACGYFLFRTRSDWSIFQKGQLPLLNWLGRHSLLVYLLHQPVLYGICMIYMYFM